MKRTELLRRLVIEYGLSEIPRTVINSDPGILDPPVQFGDVV